MKSRGVFALLVAATAFAAAPRLSALAAQAWELRDVSFEARHRAVHPIRDVASALKRTLGSRDIVAIVARSEADVDAAIFLNYYLYPQPARLYRDLGGYRLDPTPGRVGLLIDVRRSQIARRLTYEMMRAEEIGTERRSKDDPSRVTAARFLVPLAASVDGPPPDMYTTEAVIENPGTSRTEVRFELLPAGRVNTIDLEPQERREWTDVVFQMFATPGQGWLRVTATDDIAARFWFVNRGRVDVSALEHVHPGKRATFDLPHGGRLWLVNPEERGTLINVNERDVPLERFGRWSADVAGHVVCEGEQPFIAFGSWRDASGRVHFVWPDGVE